jgi:hypothetical protein
VFLAILNLSIVNMLVICHGVVLELMHLNKVMNFELLPRSFEG